MIQTNNKKFPFRVYGTEEVKTEQLLFDFEKYSEFDATRYRVLVKAINDELATINARLTALENA